MRKCSLGVINLQANRPLLQDHLFIGYALEDGVFARWLTLRLATEGYKVWCDQIKLLGGESYPKNIRKAIRESTFRFLAVISKYSIDKDNPLKERTLATKVGEVRGIDDFLIPLNLDGSRAADLDLLTTDITYIPFHKGWAAGLTQLMTKLQRINAPKVLPEGKQAVVSWLNTVEKFVEKKQERIWSNIIPIIQFPGEIHRYYVTNIVKPAEDNWPIYTKSKNVAWAFGPPGRDAPLQARETRMANWTTELEVDDLDTFHIASGILRQAIQNFCIRKGMRFSESRKDIYFPFGMFPNDKLTYKRFDGKSVYVKAVGRKTIKKRTGESEKSWYHLAPWFQPILNRFGNPCYQMNFRLVWTDAQGNEQKVPTGRRRLKWWNYQWLARTLAVNSWLTDGRDSKEIFVADNFSITIAGKPLDLASQDHINEVSLSEYVEDDDENEEIEEEDIEEENDEEPKTEDKNIDKLD